MAEEGAKREGGELFGLPLRKRFKVMEQRRREKEQESPGVGSHCSDITNVLPLHSLPPKKLTSEGFLLLEKQKYRLQQPKLQENLVSEMLPLPPRPVAVKRKEAPALPLLAPPTMRLKFQREKIHSPSPSAFKSWGSSSLKKGIKSEVSSALPGIKKCGSEDRRVSGQRHNLHQRDSRSDARFVGHSKIWAMEKGTTCSMNKAQEDDEMILCETPVLSSDICSSDEDVIASTSTTLPAPLVAMDLNVLVGEGDDGIHAASDDHMIEASHIVEVDTLPSVLVEDGIHEVQAVEEEGRESKTTTRIITADLGCCAPLDDTSVDDSHYPPGSMATVTEVSHVDVPQANDHEENADITRKMSSKSCLLPVVGPMLVNPVEGTELSGAGESKVGDAGNTSIEIRGLEEAPEVHAINATLGVPEACTSKFANPLTTGSSIATSVKSISAGAILNISKTSEDLMVTIHSTKEGNTVLNRCAKADRETCSARKFEEVAAQVVGDDSMDLGKTELQGDEEKMITKNLSDVLLVNGERVIQETDTEQDKLFAEIDERAEKLFKRMFEREGHNGCHDEQDSSDVSSSQFFFASNLVNNSDSLVTGMKVDSRPTLKFQHLKEALVPTKGGRDVEAIPSVNDHQIDLGRSTVGVGGQNIPLQQMIEEMPERSPRASEGHEDSEYPETDCLIPTGSENRSSRLQEQLQGIHCKSSKENSDWDLGIEIPNFSFNMRSGMTQRVKAPSRWLPSSEIEPTNLDEVAGEDEDDGACDICRNPDGKPSDPIVYCDGCDVAVHADCYGNPLCHGVPEGDWFCAQCQSKSPNSRSCCLCPRSGGAMKMTTDGNWAHISCTVFVPEVFFRKADDLEGIDTSHVPTKRWLSTCCVCKSTGGACVDCTEIGCKSSFHVSCALKEDLAMEFRNSKSGAIVISFCQEHTAAWDEQQEARKVGRSKYKIVSREPHRTKIASQRSKLR